MPVTGAVVGEFKANGSEFALGWGPACPPDVVMRWSWTACESRRVRTWRGGKCRRGGVCRIVGNLFWLLCCESCLKSSSTPWLSSLRASERRCPRSGLDSSVDPGLGNSVICPGDDVFLTCDGGGGDSSSGLSGSDFVSASFRGGEPDREGDCGFDALAAPTLLVVSFRTSSTTCASISKIASMSDP